MQINFHPNNSSKKIAPILPKTTISKDFIAEKENTEAEYLDKLAYEGAGRIYGTPLPTDVEERLRYELDVIKNMSFPGYFLFWHDLINAAEKELDVWVGPGRGAATGSLVNYCLGITKIDPLKHGLLFERFLNPDEVSLPDIDVDFDDEGRDKALQWLKDKYGEENCAHIAVHGRDGNIGIHPCGFVVSPDAVSNHVPVVEVEEPDTPSKKVLVTKYDGSTIESTGLVKFDLLKLRILYEMKECVRLIKQNRGIDIDINGIPVDDDMTFDLYQKGRTTGTFLLESSRMQDYLRELHPTCFGDLVAMNALYRPGAMEHIPSFIARKNGHEGKIYELHVMEMYLKETYGIIVYKEQIMHLAREIAGFSQGECFELYMAMTDRSFLEHKKAFKARFIDGGKARGFTQQILEKIWNGMMTYGITTFEKSHAVSYTWISYQTAYLKAHYPIEYMTALLTSRKYQTDEFEKLLFECNAMGIVVPFDIAF